MSKIKKNFISLGSPDTANFDDNLLYDEEETQKDDERITEKEIHNYDETKKIPIGDIIPNPYQPRKNIPIEEASIVWDYLKRKYPNPELMIYDVTEAKSIEKIKNLVGDKDESIIKFGNNLINPKVARLLALAASIKVLGLIQPIVVRPYGQRYYLIAGERRVAAHKILGESFIEAVIKNISEDEMKIMAAAENTAREDLDINEKKAVIKSLLDQNKSYREIAAQLGISLTHTTRLIHEIKNRSKDFEKTYKVGGVSDRRKLRIFNCETPEERIAFLEEVIKKIREEEMTVPAGTPLGSDE